jgi:hypothetical protein
MNGVLWLMRWKSSRVEILHFCCEVCLFFGWLLSLPLRLGCGIVWRYSFERILHLDLFLFVFEAVKEKERGLLWSRRCIHNVGILYIALLSRN